MTRREARVADLEALDRVAAVRRVTEAISLGLWLADPRVIDGLACILKRAAMWARVAEGEK